MVTTDYDYERAVVVHRADGNIYLSDLMSALFVWQQHDDFDSATPVLWDLTGVTQITMSMVDLTSDVVAYFEEHGPTGRNAWVITNDFGAAMIETLRGKLQKTGEWSVFPEVSEAEKWLSDLSAQRD